MEVKTIQIKNDYVAMIFIPKSYDDIIMAETIFGNIIAEHYGQEIFEPFPYEKSSFTMDEITKMISSIETTFFYNEENRFVMETKNDGKDDIAKVKKILFDENYHKKLEDYSLVNNMIWIKCIQPEEDIKNGYGWIDVKYQIQVGENNLESFISEWSTDWDKIRHDLEHLIWHGETEIRINYEDSPTIIKLSKESALESRVEIDGGIFFNWEPLIRVEVIPNDFIKDKVKPFFGYDRQLSVINSIYYGLQSLAKAYPEENEDNPEMTKQNVLKKLQSHLIEDYIDSLVRDESRRSQAKIHQQKMLSGT